MKKVKTGTCAECKTYGPIEARGMCSHCYNAERYAAKKLGGKLPPVERHKIVRTFGDCQNPQCPMRARRKDRRGNLQPVKLKDGICQYCQERGVLGNIQLNNFGTSAKPSGPTETQIPTLEEVDAILKACERIIEVMTSNASPSSPLVYRKELPNEVGWWWYRTTSGAEHLIEVRTLSNGAAIGEWAGPVAKPRSMEANT